MSQEKVIKGSFVILNDKGLHTRPATELVKCATAFKSQINLTDQELHVNAKSILGILMLAASQGTRIDIEAKGEDAQEAVDAIIALAKNKFHVKY